MLSRLVLAAALLVPFAAVACSSSDDGKTGDDQNITAGAEGSMCGGLAGFRCAEGLECKTTGPSHPDQAGRCVRKTVGANEGEMCGGIAGITCAEGLSCQGANEGPGADQAGTCQPNRQTDPPAGAQRGATCGGIAGIGCGDGLECKMTGAHHPDQSGKCEVKCPSRGTVNCMPPTTTPACKPDFRSYIEDHCPGVSYLD